MAGNEIVPGAPALPNALTMAYISHVEALPNLPSQVKLS
jgi:hypothetical protein